MSSHEEGGSLSLPPHEIKNLYFFYFTFTFYFSALNQKTLDNQLRYDSEPRFTNKFMNNNLQDLVSFRKSIYSILVYWKKVTKWPDNS